MSQRLSTAVFNASRLWRRSRCHSSLSRPPWHSFSKVQQPSARWPGALVAGNFCSTTPTPKHFVSSMDRFVLRFTKTVKSNEVPSEVSCETMDKANSRFRIGLMCFMMLFCLAGSLYAISEGKKNAAAHINSVQQQNRDRYARLKEQNKNE